jgi:hypothetical protein
MDFYVEYLERRVVLVKIFCSNKIIIYHELNDK